MDQLVIDISDKIEVLGILFANLIEGCPLNELLSSDLNNITYEQQDPVISSTQNCVYLSETVDNVPGDAQYRKHRAPICATAESPAIWMGSDSHPDNGWRPWSIGNQHYTQGRFQITGSRSFYGQCGCYLCAGSIPAVQELRRLEPLARTLFAHSNINHRSGWLLRPQPIQRSTSFGFKRYHVASGIASNKGPPPWSQTQ